MRPSDAGAAPHDDVQPTRPTLDSHGASQQRLGASSWAAVAWSGAGSWATWILSPLTTISPEPGTKQTNYGNAPASLGSSGCLCEACSLKMRRPVSTVSGRGWWGWVWPSWVPTDDTSSTASSSSEPSAQNSSMDIAASCSGQGSTHTKATTTLSSTPGRCSMCGGPLARPEPTSKSPSSVTAAQGTIFAWLQGAPDPAPQRPSDTVAAQAAPQGNGSGQHLCGARAQRWRHTAPLPGLARLAVTAAAATLVIHSVAPAGLLLLRGRRLAGTAARVVLLLAGRRVAQARHAHQGRDGNIASSGNASARDLLALPGLPWLSEDNARRLLINEAHDLGKARAKARSIQAMRDAMGLDAIRHCVLPAPAPPSRLGRWLPSVPSALLSRGAASGKPGTGRAAGPPVGCCLALDGAAQFPEVARMLGGTLVHIDDQAGLAVLWVQGASLGAVRAGMRRLLGRAATAAGPGRGQGAGEPLWLTRCAVHVALLSDWLWNVRLLDFPPSAGRHIQVIDLKGLRVSVALGDGLAVLRSIVGAATQYPQRLAGVLVLNPPPGVGLAWRIVSQLLPGPVAAKIRFLRGSGAGLLGELSSVMPACLIPAEYGGGWTAPMEAHPTQREVEAAMAAAAASR